MELSPGDKEVNLMLQGIHSQILHVVRKSQTINSACGQCEGREQSAMRQWTEVRLGAERSQRKASQRKRLGTCMVPQGMGRKAGGWVPVWTMASRTVFSRPSLGLLYLCP